MRVIAAISVKDDPSKIHIRSAKLLDYPGLCIPDTKEDQSKLFWKIIRTLFQHEGALDSEKPLNDEHYHYSISLQVDGVYEKNISAATWFKHTLAID